MSSGLGPSDDRRTGEAQPAQVSIGPRTVSLLVRLHLQSAAAGQIVGDVEIVDTGETMTVRDAAALTDVARRVADQRLSLVDPARSTRQIAR